MSNAAQLMKRGLISDKAYGKMSKKVGVKAGGSGKRPKVQDDDVAGPPIDEISPSTSPDKVRAAAQRPDGLGTTPLSAKSKPGVDPGSTMNDTNAKTKVPAASGSANPTSKFRKRGSDKTFRGQPQDEEFKTQ